MHHKTIKIFKNYLRSMHNNRSKNLYISWKIWFSPLQLAQQSHKLTTMILLMHMKIFIERSFVSIQENKLKNKLKNEDNKIRFTLNLFLFHSLLIWFKINECEFRLSHRNDLHYYLLIYNESNFESFPSNEPCMKLSNKLSISL